MVNASSSDDIDCLRDGIDSKIDEIELKNDEIEHRNGEIGLTGDEKDARSGELDRTAASSIPSAVEAEPPAASAGRRLACSGNSQTCLAPPSAAHRVIHFDGGRARSPPGGLLARFTTRVELHDADDSDYNELHKYMHEEGFVRTIEGDGKRYRLPPAEYNRVAALSCDDVRSAAARAAHRTGRDYAILVTEGTRCWVGLDEV